MFVLPSMFFLPLVGVGSGQNTTLISLDQAIDLALAHNHSIKATRTLIFQNPAQDSRDISEYAYRRGAASLLDFLDAERSYRSLQLAYRQALTSYMTALEQLKEAVGTRNLP
ncbi:MAG: TolC family protein [Candidatus Sulfotelmatobacter sp.]|jgi:outer membrane protein TolC